MYVYVHMYTGMRVFPGGLISVIPSYLDTIASFVHFHIHTYINIFIIYFHTGLRVFPGGSISAIP